MSDYERFLNHFVKLFLTVDKYHDLFLAEGVDYREWPDCEAKKVMTDYTSIIKIKNRKYAQYQLLDFVDSVRNDNDFPSSVDNILALYKKFKDDKIIKDLKLELVAAPHNYREILFKYSSQFSDSKKEKSFVEDFQDLYSETVRISKSKEAIRKIPGFECLSELIGGFNPGRVALLIAKTGFGKTNLAVSLAVGIAKKFNVLFANMEMNEQDFFEKMAMSGCNISFNEIKTDPASRAADVLNFARDMADRGTDIHYTDGSSLSIDEIRSMCIKLKAKKNIDFLIVDYDQKIQVAVTRETPEWKALQIAVESLELIAKQLNIFVLLLAQEVSGDVGASKRSKNPASVVLKFSKGRRVKKRDSEESFKSSYYPTKRIDSGEENVFYIQAIKNRFGPTGGALVVNYKPERAMVIETDERLTYEEVQDISQE